MITSLRVTGRRRALMLGASAVVALGAAATAHGGIYWTGFNAGTIGTASLDGTGANPSAITGVPNPFSMAAAAGTVYWYSAASGYIGYSDAALSATPGSMGTGNPAGSPFGFSGLAADGARVYSTLGRDNSDPGDPATWTEMYWQTAPGAGAPASGLLARWPVANRPEGLAVSGGFLYWADPIVQFIGRMASSDGTDPTTFVSAGAVGSTPDFVAVRDPYLYWTDGANHKIGRARIDAPNSDVDPDFITGLGGGNGEPKGIAVTATHIYWADFHGNTIGRARLDGTGVDESFISAPGAPAGLAILGEDLSVTRAGGGSGSVTSSPAGVACGATCVYTFDPGTSVTLTAAASDGSAFTGWTGACTGSGATCVVTMGAARSVTATFDPVAGPAPGGGGAPGDGGAGSPPAPTAAPPALPGATPRCTGTTCVTTGTLPAGATSVKQSATTASGATSASRETARKAVRGTCTVTKPKRKKARSTYRCSIRLAKGRWSVTTTAVGGTTVVARTTKTVLVRGARR